MNSDNLSKASKGNLTNIRSKCYAVAGGVAKGETYKCTVLKILYSLKYVFKYFVCKYLNV